MIKKSLLSLVMVFGLLFVASVALAEDSATTSVPTTGVPVVTTTTTNTTTADKIKCVAAAVATREASLGVAVSTHNSAISAAYTTRATTLAGAYANTTSKGVRAGVKVAWADFSKSVKSANTAWKTSKNTAWSTFKSAVKACKGTSDISDSMNSYSEIKGE